MLCSWQGLSGLCWVRCNGRGPHLEGRQEPQASSQFRTPTARSLHCWDRRVMPVLSEEWNSGCLSSCSGSLRPLVELCVDPAGFSGRCTRVSVPLRVVPSSTGLPLKRCPGIVFLSRADRGIGVFRHVLPPMKLRLKYSH